MAKRDKAGVKASGAKTARTHASHDGKAQSSAGALRPYYVIADALAALFSPFVEAVVHDMRTNSVAYVAHPFSPRAAGDPSDLEEVDFAPDASVIGPYEKINWDGRRIKSVTAVLRDEQGRSIGLLCVNADVTEFDTVRRMLDGFLRVPDNGPSPDDLFRNDWHERINRYIADWIAARGTTVARLDREQRRGLIEDLYRTGAFDGKRAPAYVAGVLGISRATVYAQLADIRSAAGG
ncbi:Transcriptional regulator [Bordetella sputigena]|uniref:helix-turn-helix transcriptional regulator n=1 Tax=Bordetella sputigena TaxID=1416810 RepID=UPI0039EF86E9